MAYRTNVTDKQQHDFERAQFNGGIPVFLSASNTKEIVKSRGHAPLANVRPAGVIQNHDDNQNLMMSDLIGR